MQDAAEPYLKLDHIHTRKHITIESPEIIMANKPFLYYCCLRTVEKIREKVIFRQR